METISLNDHPELQRLLAQAKVPDHAQGKPLSEALEALGIVKAGIIKQYLASLAPAPAPKARRAIIRRIESAGLNPEITKAQVHALTEKAFELGAITGPDRSDVLNILSDRAQSAEDALCELQTSVNSHQ